MHWMPIYFVILASFIFASYKYIIFFWFFFCFSFHLFDLSLLLLLLVLLSSSIHWHQCIAHTVLLCVGQESKWEIRRCHRWFCCFCCLRYYFVSLHMYFVIGHRLVVLVTTIICNDRNFFDVEYFMKNICRSVCCNFWLFFLFVAVFSFALHFMRLN